MVVSFSIFRGCRHAGRALPCPLPVDMPMSPFEVKPLLDRDQGIQGAFKESRDQGPAVFSDLILLVFYRFILTSDITLGVSLWAFGPSLKTAFLILFVPCPYHICQPCIEFSQRAREFYSLYTFIQGIQQMALNILWLYA